MEQQQGLPLHGFALTTNALPLLLPPRQSIPTRVFASVIAKREALWQSMISRV
ncbi:MAG: hypothetical protein SVU69_11930 [Pseudomonadota bacterium]|nr:hypothetical protein [Pseudomonadota bacterium]